MSKREKIVIKIGSSTLTNEQGKLDILNLKRIVSEVSSLKKQVILVTSGAVVTGAERLGLKSKPKTISQKQAAAAVGQTILMRQYEKAFEEYGITVAQILLTRDAIANRERYLNARNTILTLLEEGVVPIVNENDTVAVEEIKVGDNDTLSALVSSLIGADLLILLTDVDGFYMEDKEIPYKVDVIEEITDEIKSAAGHPSTQLGTGGMITKLQAAQICMNAGIPTVIASGKKKDIIKKIIEKEKIGTRIQPKGSKLESRKRWLAHGLKKEGTIIVDEGAKDALVKKNKSLLPVGIKEIKGEFISGDLVSIVDLSGKEFARGLVNFSSLELAEIYGKKGASEVVDRDNLVII